MAPSSAPPATYLPSGLYQMKKIFYELLLLPVNKKTYISNGNDKLVLGWQTINFLSKFNVEKVDITIVRTSNNNLCIRTEFSLPSFSRTSIE